MPPVGRSIPITIGVDSARYSGGLSMPDRRNRGRGGISFFQIQRLTPSAGAARFCKTFEKEKNLTTYRLDGTRRNP
jgi:hypothetical protein